MIKKDTIIVTSIGRTGTEFFAKFFADIIPDCTSLHEPDIVQFVGVESRIRQFIQQIRQAGAWRVLFLKPFGKWSLVKLSDARFLGVMDYAHAVKKLYTQRAAFIQSMPGSVYVESNIGYYGLSDIASSVFQNQRIIYIVRDGRDWVRSSMNWGEIYGKRGLRKIFSHIWPIAKDLPDDPLAEKWDTLSRFEKLCWVWARLNEFALNALDQNPNARMFKFEEIFSGEERYQYLDGLLRFTAALPSINTMELGRTTGWLERRIHQSSAEFPGWEDWSYQQKSQFKDTCGTLMERLGYDF
ncbi:MAG: hypothetical protein C3F07_13290 [Anaerolineales bacterium]|nr:MAG: hypothetical protein C3F07_13290 [Anaerolineales bacterium]